VELQAHALKRGEHGSQERRGGAVPQGRAEQPDILYTDGPLPFEEYGLSLVAHLYNDSARRHGGKVEAVYNSKLKEDCAEGTCVLDFERGLADAIAPNQVQVFNRGAHSFHSPSSYSSWLRISSVCVSALRAPIRTMTTANAVFPVAGSRPPEGPNTAFA
jgi:hypothetical protein